MEIKEGFFWGFEMNQLHHVMLSDAICSKSNHILSQREKKSVSLWGAVVENSLLKCIGIHEKSIDGWYMFMSFRL